MTLSECSKGSNADYDKTAKELGEDQTKLTPAKAGLDEAMKKHEAGIHQGAMTGVVEAMTMIAQARP